MKWRNHLDIADAVADAMDLTQYQREVMRQASVEPDRHGERTMRFDRKGEPYLRWMRHHRPEREVIESLAWKGRRAYLEGRDDDAVWCVGKALHFLQDDCVYTGLLGAKHDESEEAIAGHHASVEAVTSGVRDARVSVNFMRECLRSIGPSRDPVTALDRACLFSGALAASVLRGKAPDRRTLVEWHLTRRRFWLMVLPASVLGAVAAPTAALVVNEPALALAALPALLAPWCHRRYWFLREEMTWFGL